jgi:hypothetical protein
MVAHGSLGSSSSARSSRTGKKEPGQPDARHTQTAAHAIKRKRRCDKTGRENTFASTSEPAAAAILASGSPLDKRAAWRTFLDGRRRFRNDPRRGASAL